MAAAATAAAAEVAAASKAAAAHDRHQNRYRGERAARPRRAHALEKPDMLKEPGGGAGLMNGEDFSGGQCLGAFDHRTREYTGFGVGCWLPLGSAMGPGCAC